MNDNDQPLPGRECWAVEIDDGALVACDSEQEAIDCQQMAEYELGFVAVIHGRRSM